MPGSLLAQRFLETAAKAGLRSTVRELELAYPTAPTVPLPVSAGRPIRAFWEEREAIEARLDQDAADPTIREYTGPVDRLVPEMTGVDVLLLHTAPVSRNTIAAADQLQVVGTVRTGPVNVNVDVLSERGIPLINTPGRNAEAVAEFIFGALIAHLRHIVPAAIDLREQRWSLYPWSAMDAGFELKGKTLGLVGFGRVGQAFAPIARGIGLDLLVSDPFVDPAVVVAAGGYPLALDDLLARSDIVVLVARLNDRNRHMIGERAFELMKGSAILVNTARSELVDTQALVEALRSGSISGAVVDVLDLEPPLQSDELLASQNVLVTPHIAGATRDTVVRGAGLLAEAVVAYLAEGRLNNCVNRARLEERALAPATRSVPK